MADTQTSQMCLALAAARIEGEGDAAALVFEHGRLALPPNPGVRAALMRLAASPASEAALVELVRARADASELPVLFYYLRSLEAGGLLAHTVVSGDARLLSVAAFAEGPRVSLAPLADDRPLVLSRFAYLRRRDAELVLESAATHARVHVHDARVAALLHALGVGASLEQLATAEAALPREALGLCLRALLGSGHLRHADDPREEQPPLATWSFEDLTFHGRSRVGRHDGVVGKSYPFLGKLDPLPALRPRHAGPIIALPRPDIDALARDDASFTHVLEARCSVRDQGDAPLSLAALAEFLYRAARVRRFTPAAPPVHYEVTNRPSPGGGGCHELELYLAVDRCQDLAAGLYHYDPRDHVLVQLCARTPDLDAMLADTKVATAAPRVSQVLVCIAARFGRMAWPYEGIPYATTLKNTGALLQTMYLVATAMGLAPCAMGRGNSDLFAKVAGTDYYAETSVGEFMLGSRAT